MVLIELNRKSEELREILMGICLNSGKNNVSRSATRVIARDVRKCNPDRLYHCYVEEELKVLLLKLYKTLGGEFKVREIIPTQIDLGIIRDLDYNYSKPESLLDQIWHLYRYYIIHNYKEQGESKCNIITYNPDLRELNNINVKLSETLNVNCGVMQFGDVRELNRVLSIKNIIDEKEGTYIVYSIESEDNING